MSARHTPGWFAERAGRRYVIAMAQWWAELDTWSKAIQAAQATDKAWSVETRVYRGRENREIELMEGEESSLKRLPCVILRATSGQAVLPNYRGLWTCKLEAQVWHNRARTTGDQADEMAQNVFDLFLTTTILTDLGQSAPGFSVRDVIPQDFDVQAVGRAWLSQMSFSLEQVSGNNG